ncbi:hypothetical protein LPJ59_005181, partial [Coemansia sp. RSA 2399]
VSEFTGHKAGITSLAAGYGNRGPLLVSGSEDKTSRLWDTRSGKAICGVVGFEKEVVAADFVGDSSIAIASGASISLYDQRYIGTVHNARNSGAVYVCKDDSGESEIQAISTRGDFVAFVDDDGRLGVFDITDPEMLTGKSVRFSSDGHDAMAACVCFHPEEPVVATGAFDRQVCVWDVASEKVIRRSVARPIAESAQHVGAGAPGATTSNMVNPPFVYALDFVPGFAYADDVPNKEEDREQWMVVSGHADGRIMCTGAKSAVCWTDCHSYSITALRFMRSHPEILATAGLDRTIKLWNSDSIISPDNVDGDNEDSAAVVRDSLPLLAHIDLAAKPDTLATFEEASVIYTDENNSVVAFAIV